jgi:hypothetical protein
MTIAGRCWRGCGDGLKVGGWQENNFGVGREGVKSRIESISLRIDGRVFRTDPVEKVLVFPAVKAAQRIPA